MYSLTHASGFHYETYGEISPSRTLSYASLLSLILPFQIYIRQRKYILHRWYGDMGSSQHSSPHQALAMLGLDVVGDLCSDEPIPPSQRCRMHIIAVLLVSQFELIESISLESYINSWISNRRSQIHEFAI